MSRYGDRMLVISRRIASVALRVVLVGTVTAGLAGCGSTSSGSPSSSEATSASVAGPLGFTAPLVGGGEFDGAAHAGKPVAFWFWAPT